MSEETLRKAHRDETRLATLNASIDKENQRIMLENLINKNTQRYEKHVKLSHAASLIELDPDKFIPVDARGISKNYTKFKKAVKDAHLANYGIMNVEKYTKINFIFNIDIVIHIVFNIIKGNSKNRLSSL